MCNLSQASQRLAPILRALSSISHTGLQYKRNQTQLQRLLSSQYSLDAPILRALSSISHNGLQYKRNPIQLQRLLSSQYSSDAAEKVNYTWLRAAKPWEEKMDAWNRNHTRIGIPCVTFNSKISIPEDTWKNAVKHIHQQTLMLRLDMVNRGNKKWLCEINMDPDVKLLDNQTPSEVLDELYEEGIENSQVKIRIVSAKSDDLCLLPSIRREYPYQYSVMCLSNHGICDGQSILMVYIMLWMLLCEMLAGRDCMEKLPFDKYTNGEELSEIERNLRLKFANDPYTLQKEKEILESTIKTPLLNEVFSIIDNNEGSSKYSYYVLEDNIIQPFIKKCKSNGVKISSGVLAAINTSIVEMVKDAGLHKDCYHLSVMENVDMRRYIKKNLMPEMGFFGGRIHQSYYIYSNIRDNFWDHSKEINSRKSNLLQNEGPILQSIVRKLTLHPYDPNVKRGPTDMEWDYTFNNLLDLTAVEFSQTDLVQATDILPSNMTHNFTPFQIMLQTFRGIVRLSLSYSTNCMTENMAQELMERVINVIRDMALSSEY